MTTIPALLAAAVARHGDQVAVVDGDVQLSYAEVERESQRVGAALLATGIRKGDRVAIWSYNSVEWILALFGILHAGAVLVPINTRFKGTEAADILRRSGARALLSTTDFLGTNYVELLEGQELPSLDTTITSLAEFTAGASPGPGVKVAEHDPSDILFTSGTTGAPKGVVQTHGRTVRVATDWIAMTGLVAGDRYLMVNPYFHMFGLKAGILASVAAGAVMLPQPVFDVDRVLARVAEEQVTVLPGAPTLYQSILDHPDRGGYDLSSLRIAVTGAADIPVELIRRVRAELPFSVVITGYGLTEAGTATATSPDDGPDTVATTVGRPRPGFELRLDDAEIMLRGPSVMSHYLDDPDATAATLSPDGWLRTGDLGEVGDDGCLRIIGRAKDMFIVGGFNAYPAEIENMLLRHPDIQQAAVIGVPDDRLGEVGMAFVVLRAGATATPDAVVDWARAEMANYKVPRRVEIVDELPLNATGKVMKDVLRERAAKVNA